MINFLLNLVDFQLNKSKPRNSKNSDSSMRANSKQLASNNFPTRPTLRSCTSEKILSLKRSCQDHTVMEYRYSELDILGKGFSSKVYKAYHTLRPSQTYAIKVIDLSKFRSSSLEMLNSEIEIQKSVNHPNLVRCFDSFTRQGFCYIVTQYCPNGDLMGYLRREKRLPERNAVEIIKQIVSGYQHLVKMGVLHRDLKPANIFKSGSTWKIGDFGFAIRQRNQFKDRINVGTPLYMPMQALIKNKYSIKSDLFALGIIAYELICGRTPWECSSEKELIRKMSKEKLEVPSGLKCQTLIALISKGGEIDDSNRLTADQFQKMTFWNDNPEQVPFSLRSTMKGSGPRCGSPGSYKIISGELSKRNTMTSQDLLGSLRKVRTAEKQNQKDRIDRKAKEKQYLGYDLPSQSTTQEENSQENTKSGSSNANQNKSNNFHYSPSTPVRDQHIKWTEGSPLAPKPTVTEPSRSSPFKINSSSERRNTGILICQLQLCRFLYYFIKNIKSLTIAESHQQNLKMMLFKHLLKMIKQLEQRKQNSFGLQDWESFRSSQAYAKISMEFKQYSLRYEREYLEYLKNVDVNTIRVVNKSFPELSQQGSKIRTEYFSKARKYLKLLLRTNNHGLGLKIKADSIPLYSREVQGLSSLFEYYNFLESTVCNLESSSPNAYVLRETRLRILTDYSTSKLTSQYYFEKMRRHLINI